MESIDTPARDLTIALHMDDTLHASLRANEGALTEAQAYIIDSPVMADITNTELRSVVARKKQVAEWRKKFIEPAKQIIANAEALFDPAITALESAERHLKGLLLDWTQKEAARVAEERRKAEEEAQRAREEAEAKAAAARARAEAEAAEKRRQAEEAERERQRAEAEGNARAAAAAAAAAARLREESDAKIAQGERRAEEAQLTVAASNPTPIQAAAAPAGFSTRKNWIAELAPGTSEEAAKRQIVAAIAGGRNDLLALLDLDMKAAAKLAKALEANFNVPGLAARNAPVASSRAA